MTIPALIAAITVPNADAMATLGGKMADFLAAGDVVCLRGGLGAGKTCLARGLVRAVMGDKTMDVPSPTYTLVQTYEPDADSQADFDVWHFDLYRLDAAKDVWALGIEEAFDAGVCVIEWPERIESLLSGAELELRIAPDDHDGRVVQIYGNDNWAKRLSGFGDDDKGQISDRA